MATTLGDDPDHRPDAFGRGAGRGDKAPDAEAGVAGPGKGRASRRSVIRAGLAALGGLAATPLLPLTATRARAAGTLVSPNPIKPKIRKSGLAVELVDFSAPPRTSTNQPYAALNFLYHVGDGSGRLFVADSRGKLWRIDRKTGAASLFLDLRKIRGGALNTRTLQMGLRSFAFHPDFARQGRPGYRKLYTVSVETVASRPGGVRIFDGPYTAIADDVVAEWSVDPANPSRVDPASRRELLRVTEWGPDHNADTAMFDPNARPGDAGYGKMFVTVGDSGNNPPHTDPYDLAQNPGSAHGKLLRINPLKQTDGEAYGIPADNPFVGRAGYLPEVWALGLRHPQNLSFDRGGTRAMVLTDIGQHQIEEVNLGVRGANYGWPLREGTFVTDRTDESKLYRLPADDATYGFTYPVAQYDHDEGSTTLGKAAIAGGYVYRGATVPALAGQYLFGDIVNGRVFHVPASALTPGSQAVVHELTLLRNGAPVTLLELVGASSPSGRVDLRFGQDEAGEVYLLTKQDGKIRKLRSAAA